MADMKDKKEETIHQEEEAVKAEDVTETAETAERSKECCRKDASGNRQLRERFVSSC